MVAVKKGSRAHQQTPKSGFGCASWRQPASLREQLRDHQAPSDPSHPTLLTLANSISTTPTSLSHIDPLCKEAPFLLHRSHLHNRQHGFGGNYDCVRLACHASYHFTVLTPFTVSTTARAAETATTYLRDGMPKQTLPTSSSNTRHKPTPNPQSAS
jgi:hypothetical protein